MSGRLLRARISASTFAVTATSSSVDGARIGADSEDNEGLKKASSHKQPTFAKRTDAYLLR